MYVQKANISDPSVIAVAGFSPRTCHGGILFWNNASVPYTSTLNVSSLPYNNFTVQVYVLDANHLPGVSSPFSLGFSSKSCTSLSILCRHFCFGNGPIV